MSPKRKFDTGVDSATNTLHADYFGVPPKPSRRWGLPLVAVLAAVVVVSAIAASTLMLVRLEIDRWSGVRGAAAIGCAREFMTAYLTLDPSNADSYSDRILAQSTGEFAKMFAERQNEILLRVTDSGPAGATVVEAGVQQWNSDGSVEVLLAMEIATAAPDRKSMIESGSRWIATAVKEGQEWKISSLVQVI
ncbi:MAG: mammalian cell entry protein [Mycobacterium sp.]